jgi:membrane protease YdiL (CAAX protease family)
MPSPIRRARRGTLLFFLIAHAALITVVNLLLFAHGAFRPLAEWTGGLLTGTLVANLLLIVLLVGGICLWFGRLRPYDIGWMPAQIPAALLFCLCLWGAAQVVHLLAGWAWGGAVRLDAAWLGGMGIPLGVLLGQVLGNALFEELAYRGFIFPQLYLRLHGDGERPWSGFLLTLLISQALFALVHIPNRLYLGMSAPEIAADLAMLTGWGVLFTLLYLRTDNLYLVAGIHALGNAPTTLFASAPAFQGAGASLLIYALAVLAVFVLPWLLRLAERGERSPALEAVGD